MTDKELINAALSARERAYAPYSEFLVGATLLCSDGSVYSGCNIENASYSMTICAERTAFFKAVSDGRKDFSAIAIVGGKRGEFIKPYPCGACRQVMSEFCRADFRVLVAASEEDYEVYTLSEILPCGFELK